MKKIFSIFKDPYIGPIFAISIILLVIMIFIIPKYSHENQKIIMEKKAIDIVNNLKKIRAYYTEHLIKELKNHPDIKIDFDHKIKDGTIPLPATLLHDFTELLAEENMEIKLYSDYPFENRKDRVLNDFQKESLSYFVNNPNEIYTRIIKTPTEEKFAVSVPDVFFDQTCVNCHNTRIDSPKTDWKLGDVRGAIKVSVPIKHELYLSSNQVLTLFLILVALILILGIHYTIMSIRRTKEHEKIKITLEKEVNERTQELQKSMKILNQYKNAVDSTSIVSKTDKNGKITFVNDEFCRVAQYTKEELIGKNHNLIRHEDMPKEIFKDLWETIKSKQIWKGQIKNKAKDGTAYYVASTIAPILNLDDEIEEYLAIRLDVSDIIEGQLKAKRADEAKSTFLANMSHEIRTPLNAIIGFSELLDKSTNLDIQSKKQAQIINSSAVSLLTIINDILDVSKIDSGNFSLSIEESNIVLIGENVIELFSKRAMEKHIKLIFNLDPNVPICIETDGVRLKQVLSNLLSNAIKFTPKDGIVSLNISLIENQNKKAKIRFEIEDTGIGIPKDKLITIFDPFIQIDNKSNRQYQGTGLGLSISSYIIKALNSNIFVQSIENEGTKFYFELEAKTCIDNLCINRNYLHHLNFKIINKNSSIFNHAKQYLELFGAIEEEDKPIDIVIYCSIDNFLEDLQEIRKNNSNSALLILHEYENDLKNLDLNKNEYALALPFYGSKINDAIEELLNRTEKRKISIDGIKKFKGKVLVAEDNSANQELISYILQEMGIEFTIKSNGLEILNEFKKDFYDLILMDINMPVLDGVETFKQIRIYEKDNQLQKTPIVALTANAIKGDKERFLNIGMDNYLTKPINVKELRDIFEIYLNNKKTLDDLTNINIDIKKVSEKLGIGENIVNLLVHKFQNEIIKDLKELQNFIHSKDKENILQKAHYIKNSCLNLCLDDICEVLQKLENPDLQDKEKEELFALLINKLEFLNEGKK
jgi:PAS domain S-box-containing protein